MMFETGHAALLVTALSFFLIGHLALSLCGPKRARSATEWTLTALMVGAVICIVSSIAAVIAFGPLSVWTGRALIAVPALAGAARLFLFPQTSFSRLLRGSGGGLPLQQPTSRVDRYSRWVLFACGAGILFTATSSPVHLFDSMFHFGYKGRVMFTEGIGGSAWIGVDGPIGRIMTHPKYPPGVPAMEVVTSWFLGHFDASAASGLLAIFALAPAVWICSALRSRGRFVATLGALTWLAVPLLYYLRLPLGLSMHSIYGLMLGKDASEPLFIKLVLAPEFAADLRGFELRKMFDARWNVPDGGGLDGSADLPLAACLFGAVVHLWRALPCVSMESDRADWVIGTLMLAGMLLMKNEGAAFLGLLAFALLLTAITTARGNIVPTLKVMLPRLGAALSIAILLVVPWFLERASIPSVDEDYPNQLTVENLVAVVTTPLDDLEDQRLSGYAPVIVAKRFVSSLCNPLKWNLLWVTFAASLGWCLVAVRRRLLGDALLPVLMVLLGGAMYFTILVVAPWDHESLFKMGIPERLFLHLAPLAVLATFTMLWGDPEESA